MYLQLIQTNSSEYTTFPHDTGTIFYCTDINRVYIDRENRSRVNITQSTVICDNENEFNNLGSYQENKLYICIRENKFYLTKKDGVPENIVLYTELVGVVIENPDVLDIKLLRQNGNNISPVTVTNAIYDRNGNNMAETLEGLRQDVRNLNKVKTITVTCLEEGQTIFNIPKPTYDYEITSSNFFVAINDVMMTPIRDYTIDDTKIIFSREVHYDDKIQFVFHYHVVMNMNDVPDKSVSIYSLKDELREYITKNGDISDITFPDGTSLLEKLSELLTLLKGNGLDNSGIKGVITNILSILNDLKSSEDTHNQSIDNKLQEHDVLFEELKNKVDTIIENTTGITSISSVKKVIRGVSEIALNNESVEIMIGETIVPEKCSIRIQGDSYYNETPYVYEVQEDRFIVRQKSPNVTPDYTSKFSWEIIVFY